MKNGERNKESNGSSDTDGRNKGHQENVCINTTSIYFNPLKINNYFCQKILNI